MTETAWKSGDPPRQAAVADPDLGLDRARAMDRPGRLGRPSRPVSTDRRRGSPSAPSPVHDPKSRSAAADDVEAAEVAADDERRRGPAGGSARRSSRRSVAVRPLDGLARATRRPAVRRPDRVDRVDEGLLDAPTRVRLGLEQVVQSLVAEALDLGRPGRSARGRPRRRARGRRRGVRPGTSTPTDMASQPASAWSEAPSRSPASISSIASRRAVPSVNARPARTVAPARSAGSSTAPPVTISEADTSGRPGRSTTTMRQAVGQGVARDSRELVWARAAWLGRSATTGPSFADRASCSCHHLLVRSRRLRAGTSGPAGCRAGRPSRRRRGSSSGVTAR